MALLLISVSALAQDTAEVGTTLDAKARRAPATPLEMALRLEKELTKGAGMLMPIPDRQVRLSGGVIPLDSRTEGFPAEFLKGLAPDEINGVEAWRATLRTDDASGDILFYNADGEVFWTVAADAAVWSADWIARLHSTDCQAADFFSTEQLLRTLSEKQTLAKVSEDALYRAAWVSTRQYLLPSHVELTFTFILKDDLDAYRAAGSAVRSPAATVLSMPMSMSAPLTGLAVTGFAADTNGVALSAAWPTGTGIAGDALDIFFTRTLIPPAWTNMWRVAVDPAAGGLDVAIPRSELPPASEAVPAVCVTNIVPSAYDPGVMVTNIVCTNAVWLTDSGFFRLADLADTDGDGLTDACEKWMYGTRSDLIDTDGDTLDDGWEIKYGLNPFTLDDPSADPDDDGLTHAEECVAGTDPFNGDTDGDGLKDGAEVFAAVARNAGASAFSVDGGAVLSAPWTGGRLDSGVTNVSLPFPVWIEGRALSNLSVNANGLIGLYNATTGSGLGTGFDGGWDMEGGRVSEGCPLVVAGFWEDMQLYPADLGSAVTLADVTTNGSHFCVIEYRNVGFYNVDPSTNDTVSFQIVFEQGVSNKVSVCFQAARGRGEGGDATLGAQTDRRSLQHAYGDEGSAYAGLALSYLFGLGTDPLEKDSDEDGLEDGDEVNEWFTDPLVKDTDGDGLEDGDEATLGTSPTNPDTDGDGMTDGWEAENLLDPLDPADAYDDPDTDGLPNIAEFRAGTNPRGGDWDGDGVPDGVEAAWWVAAAQLPWFDVSGGTVVLQNSDLDDELLFAALPFPVRIGGSVCTNAALDVNGIVYLLDGLKLADDIYTRNGNGDMEEGWPLTGKHFAVAAHWDNLLAQTASPATMITVADMATNGARYCVIEYRDMGFSTNSSARVSFQIVIPENGTNTVCVRYDDVAGANTGGAATLGAQGPGAAINIPVSFDRPFITDGLTLVYHFGSGGSPFVKDTDGDGLEDGEEAALGTSPANPDSDGDGLPDKWEAVNALNPLSASGNDGADGDPDGDGLLNRDEFDHNVDPHNADKDEDGLTDIEELGGVTPAAIPWFDLSGGEDLTPLFSNLDYSGLTVPLSVPAVISGTVFTNLTLDINGIVYLNPTGYQNSAYSSDWHDDMEDWTVDEDALTLAPFWANLIAVTNTDRASTILSGTASDGTNQYHVIEYRNMRIDAWPVSTNNMVTFQLAIPTGATDRVFVRYALASGTADGQDASVGLQGLGGKQKDAWCFDQAGRVQPGLSLALVIGTGSNPQILDTDNDGLSDAEEAALGTDPRKRDTDGDRLPDRWELDNGFNPLVNNDTDGIEGNGVEDDLDCDGLSNFDEYLNGTDPKNPYSDVDGANDGDEVGQGSDPNDASDNGQPPPPQDILELPFHITGDYAAWEMIVEGLGPGDTRVFKLSTDAPDDEETVTNKLHRGNSYRLTMRWLESIEDDVDWYCWQAQIDGLPAQQTYTISEDGAVRRSGIAVTVAGDGWFAENADGLLSAHIHTNDDDGGNVAGGLEAILYVPKVELRMDIDDDGDIDKDDRDKKLTPGAIIFENWDNDDNHPEFSPDKVKMFVAGEDDLVASSFLLAPPIHVGELKLEATSGASKIKVWTSPEKVVEVTLPTTWQLSGASIPSTLYLEGYDESGTAKDSELQLSYRRNGMVITQDKLKVTVVRLNLASVVHRELAVTDNEWTTWLPLLGCVSLITYDHAGMIIGYNGGRTRQGLTNDANWSVAEMQSGIGIQTVSLAVFKKPSPTATLAYFGANRNPVSYENDAKRNELLQTAMYMVDVAHPGYPSGGGNIIPKAIEFMDVTGEGVVAQPIDVWTLRCDGLPEFVYEWAGVPLWTNTQTGHTSIRVYPEDHNNRPDCSADPYFELSPRAQWGGFGNNNTSLELFLHYQPGVQP